MNSKFQLRMWRRQNNKEVLDWKHGRITISDQEVEVDEKSILLSTPPFNSAINVLSSEEHKSLPQLESILESFLEHKVNRESTVYIKGGGLLLDMGGFACAIYMRGVKRVVYLPTTLLAIVDATIGGKTGVNWADTKNMLGVVRHPDEIYINVNHLYSLSERDFANGMSEVIKMAVSYSPHLFSCLQSSSTSLQHLRNPLNKSHLTSIIKECLEIKLKVVEGDQFDNSSRKWLNFGHTVGHSIQMCTEDLKHGECVAIGMLEELQIGRHVGEFTNKQTYTRLKKVLTKYKLPTQLPKNVNPDALTSIMAKDKKNIKPDQIQLALLNSIGERKSSLTSVTAIELTRYFSPLLKISTPSTLNSQANIQQQNLPTSKSLSMRYLFLSALCYYSSGKSFWIDEFLECQDTTFLKEALEVLGFQFEVEGRSIRVVSYVKKKEGQLFVGNSGLAARFILPFCCHIGGSWTIECEDRMSHRPNTEILKYCQHHYNCQFTYFHQNSALPLQLHSTGLKPSPTPYQISNKSSSQYLSSVLLNTCLHPKKILTEQLIQSQSYVNMTIACMQKFGFSAVEGQKGLNVTGEWTNVERVKVETDLSSLSYVYAFAIMHEIERPPIPSHSLQGDIAFYDYCEQIFSQPLDKNHRLAFHNCSDTFMTMAVLAVCLPIERPLHLILTGISNQRAKQSDRISYIRKNLHKIGVYTEQKQKQDELELWIELNQLDPNIISTQEKVIFECGNDHRLAMSFAVLASYLSTVYPQIQWIIDNQHCVKKTFPTFWSWLSTTNVQVQHVNDHISDSKHWRDDGFMRENIVIVGNRGAGKTTIGKVMAQEMGRVHVDVDEEIIKDISQEGFSSIGELVDQRGWLHFREVEAKVLAHILKAHRSKPAVVSVGGGVVDYPPSRHNLSHLSTHTPVLYLEKPYFSLQLAPNPQRPLIANFQQIFQTRSSHYEEVSNHIITVPSCPTYEEEKEFILEEVERIMATKRLQQQHPHYILCMDEVEDKDGVIRLGKEEMEGIGMVELRVDCLLGKQPDWRQLRALIAQFKYENLRSVNLLLTLRTEDEYGSFSGNYQQTMEKVNKIPTNYLDHQINKPLTYNYHSNKLLYSYHGHHNPSISKLSQYIPYTNTKLCYDGSSNLPKFPFDISVHLHQPLTRILTPYTMVIRRQKPTITGIGTRKQMEMLRCVKMLWKK